jgi:hypothetical protein
MLYSSCINPITKILNQLFFETKKMNKEVVEKIIKSIDEDNLSEFEKIISNINPKSLGEKVFIKF